MRPLFVALAVLIVLFGCTGTEPQKNITNSTPNVTINSTNVTGPPPVTSTGVNITRLAEHGLKIGSDDAPVIMIEFSDYQCQFCRRFWQVNWGRLKNEQKAREK